MGEWTKCDRPVKRHRLIEAQKTMKTQAFARARAMFAAISAIATGISNAADQQAAMIGLGSYRSRGHGEGLSRNKHARSSFKQNKRKGL